MGSTDDSCSVWLGLPTAGNPPVASIPAHIKQIVCLGIKFAATICPFTLYLLKKISKSLKIFKFVRIVGLLPHTTYNERYIR